MDIKENYLRAVEFNSPEWIPCTITFSPIYGKAFANDLEKIKSKYKLIFERDAGLHNSLVFQGIYPGYEKGEFTDSWGCIWCNDLEGIIGQVKINPLSDWSNFKHYKAPDPLATRPNEHGGGMFDWKDIERGVKEQRKEGKLVWGWGEKLFDRLYFLKTRKGRVPRTLVRG